MSTQRGGITRLMDLIDPKAITNFNRSEAELQLFLLFCICAAGKNATVQAKKLHEFFELGKRLTMTKAENDGRKPLPSPFDVVNRLNAKAALTATMKAVKLGKYQLMVSAFCEAASIDNLQTISRSELARIPGVNLKTASFFILHSRRFIMMAVLDTYVLRYLRDAFPKQAKLIGKTSPQNLHRYHLLETLFLGCCARRHITDIAVADLACWNSKGESLVPQTAIENDPVTIVR